MNNEVIQKDIEEKLKTPNTILYDPVFPVLTARVLLEGLPIEDMSREILTHASDIKNYPGGWTSLPDVMNGKYANGPVLNFATLPGYQLLRDAIAGVSANLGNELKFEVDYSKPAITIWASALFKGGHQPFKVTKRSTFSGIFFSKVTPGSSDIVFRDPNIAKRLHEPFIRESDMTPFTSSAMRVPSQENVMYLWPSWLEFEIPEMQQKGPLVIFCFDIDYPPLGA